MANFPPAQPIAPDAEWATEAQVLAAARAGAQDPDVPGLLLGREEQEALPAEAVLTTYQATLDAGLGGADPFIDGDRPVWVVVVHGTRWIDSAPVGTSVEETRRDVFTVVFDAPTGDVIVIGTGADAWARGLSRVSTIELPSTG